MARTRSRRHAIGGILLALAMVSTACFSGAGDGGGAGNTQPQDAGPPQPGGVYRMANTADPPTIDPHKEANARTHEAVGLSYSKLVDYNTGPDIPYGTMELEGDLAESWEMSEDATTWTFHLRQGVAFHDVAPVNGREFTSADVLCTFDRIRDLPGHQLHLISMVDTYEAPDPYTVVFHLNEPYADFDHNLGGHFMWILPCEGTSGQFDLETQAIGTGPFVLEEWERDTQRRYGRHDDYYEEGKPYLDGIEVTINPDEGARISAFRTNNLDHLERITDQAQLDLITSSMPDVIAQEELAYAPLLLYMNQDVEPFDDYRVRRAVALAIDKQSMLDSLRPGEDGGGLVSGPVTPKLFGGLPPEEDAELEPYDPEEAKSLLAEAGFPDGFTVDMIITDGYGPITLSEAQWIQQDLEAVGITAELDVQDYATYFASSWAGEDYAMGYGPQTPMLSADEYLSSMYHSEGSRNWFNINDPELDAMITEQRGILDEGERAHALLDIQRYIIEEISNPVTLYVYNAMVFYAPYVHDVYPHPDYGQRNMKDAWLGPEAPGR